MPNPAADFVDADHIYRCREVRFRTVSPVLERGGRLGKAHVYARPGELAKTTLQSRQSLNARAQILEVEAAERRVSRPVYPMHIGLALVDIEQAGDDLASAMMGAQVVQRSAAIVHAVVFADLTQQYAAAVVQVDGHDVALIIGRSDLRHRRHVVKVHGTMKELAR